MRCEMDFVAITSRCGKHKQIVILDRDPASRDALLHFLLNTKSEKSGITARETKLLLEFHRKLLSEDLLRFQKQSRYK